MHRPTPDGIREAMREIGFPHTMLLEDTTAGRVWVFVSLTPNDNAHRLIDQIRPAGVQMTVHDDYDLTEIVDDLRRQEYARGRFEGSIRGLLHRWWSWLRARWRRLIHQGAQCPTGAAPTHAF